MHKDRRHEIKDKLTNESISKKFKNTFDLVNYAIKLAENMILSGREQRIRTEVGMNPASLVLEEISLGKDQLVDLNETEEGEAGTYTYQRTPEHVSAKPAHEGRSSH